MFTDQITFLSMQKCWPYYHRHLVAAVCYIPHTWGHEGALPLLKSKWLPKVPDRYKIVVHASPT